MEFDNGSCSMASRVFNCIQDYFTIYKKQKIEVTSIFWIRFEWSLSYK